MRPALEVADVFRAHGPAWRRAHAGHISLAKLKVMSAIEACRTAELVGVGVSILALVYVGWPMTTIAQAQPTVIKHVRLIDGRWSAGG